jgi:uroporphyrinogen III methyltransferase/synthase
MNFMADLALLDRTILVACSKLKAPALSVGLEALGATVQLLPVIEIRELADQSRLDRALRAWPGYTWVLFTSAYAVHTCLNRMRGQGMLPEKSRGPGICAIGPATAAALNQGGLPVTLVPEEFVAEGVIRALAEFHGGTAGLAGTRHLIPRALQARDHIPDALRAAGAVVDVVPCYENILPSLPPGRAEDLGNHPADLVVFTSSSTVNNFVRLLGNAAASRILQYATVAALGPITARTLAAHGKTADIVPEQNTIPSLLAAIRQHAAARK